MASDVDVVNAALLKLGARPILTMTDDSIEGRLAQRRYDTVRDDVLRAHPWNFAQKRTSVAASATVPTYEYSFAYPVPTDFLRLMEIDSPNNEPWRIESMDDSLHILTDSGTPLKILYVYRVTNVDMMPMSFREALSATLALEWAEAITGSSDKTVMMEQLRSRKMSEARSVDGQEQTADDVFEAFTWTDSRP